MYYVDAETVKINACIFLKIKISNTLPSPYRHIVYLVTIIRIGKLEAMGRNLLNRDYTERTYFRELRAFRG